MYTGADAVAEAERIPCFQRVGRPFMDTSTKEELDCVWEISLYKITTPLGCGSGECVGGGGGLSFKNRMVDVNDFIFC